MNILEIDWLSEEFTNEIKNNVSAEDFKNFKNFYSKIKKESRADIKSNHCLLCGKICTSFCKSHTVPQFVLKNIAANGKLFLFNSLLENPFIDYDSGVSNAGNFFLICNECDSKIFQDYEDEDKLNILQKNNIKAYAEIALKNLLKIFYKRKLEVAQYKNISKICREEINNFVANNFLKYVEQKISCSELDISEYTAEIIKCKKILSRNYDNASTNIFFNVIDNFVIPYTVPIAYQGTIALLSDMNGEIINDLYCDDSKYKQELLHLCIFPLKNSTFITLFTHKSNKRYSKFKTQFLKLKLTDKLALINYLLFLYSEDMFLSGYFDIQKINTAEFQKVIRTNPTDNFGVISRNNLKKVIMNNAKAKFSPGNYRAIQNLLDKKFSLEIIAKFN